MKQGVLKMAGYFVSSGAPKVTRGHSAVTTRGRVSYEAFKAELDRRKVDVSSQIFGVSSWFRDVQEAGGDFRRYYDLVGSKFLLQRKTHEEAIAVLKARS